MEYGPIPVSRYNEVIEHLRYNFFPDEPLNNSVDLCQKGEPHAELEAHSLDTLKDEMSIMAVDPATGQVLYYFKFQKIKLIFSIYMNHLYLLLHHKYS